jgi:outer membrane protein insertion porin family
LLIAVLVSAPCGAQTLAEVSGTALAAQESVPAPPEPSTSVPREAASDSTLATPPSVPRVGRVHVVGNSSIDSLRIVRTFEVLPGSRYSDDAVRRGIRKLFALGLFRDVSVDESPRGEWMDLVIHVKERPRIAKITFRGNEKKETSDLEKKLVLRVGQVYSPVAVQSQVDSLLTYYRDEGFARATIEAVEDSAAAGAVELRFVIQEGLKVRIRRVEFVGAEAFPAKKLRKQLKTRAKGFFGGGEVREEDAVEDRQKLEAFYHNHGYRDMRMTGRELRATDDPRKLVLVVTVEEGPPYRVGTVEWSGNTVLSDAELAPLWRRKKEETYDASKIEQVMAVAYGEFAEKGYLYVGIEPRESVRDTDVVDVTYHVTEGQPSHVRHINIIGNTATREKVIRRELEIHEGDRFKRSALVRTQGELARLGYFEEVIPDFSPAESTDVDISIKVKEKQVGTASAGAGYTGLTGFTGFVEFGHNNILGNGQSLALHLERGSRRSNYSVSFTEPWFHDTPTLLGFSAFDLSTELDLYTEKRRGASGRIGRPLPWPDYSRGSIGYSLEDVTISQYGTSLQDSLVLSGIAQGRPVRTSSVIADFSRNSTDHAFYPTRGTRLSWVGELAGGPFLGAVNFIKNRVEGRLYLPSLVKGVTTMMRARVGVLGIWAGQNSPVPTYERFRLGGGSTPDPLRGYDDYQVVPEKFVQYVTDRYISSIDSTTTPGTIDTVYSYLSTKVRYPGGRYMTLYSIEQQFPIVPPLRGVVFFDAGNTWDRWGEIQPLDLKMSIGIGFRMEIPLLGNIGFDYGYGFHRDDGPRGRGHFLLGNVGF